MGGTMNPWVTVILVAVKAMAVATIWAAAMKAVQVVESEVLRGAVLVVSAGVVVFLGLNFLIHRRTGRR